MFHKLIGFPRLRSVNCELYAVTFYVCKYNFFLFSYTYKWHENIVDCNIKIAMLIYGSSALTVYKYYDYELLISIYTCHVSLS